MTENIVAEKLCKKCGEVKPLDDFCRVAKGKPTRRNTCKPCAAAITRAWQAKPENLRKKVEKLRAFRATPRGVVYSFIRTQIDHANKLRKKSATAIAPTFAPITVGQYEAMLAAQNSACAICGRIPQTKRLVIDHCHTSGRIRGLLCDFCNKGLGLFHDNPDYLASARHYLLSHSD